MKMRIDPRLRRTAAWVAGRMKALFAVLSRRFWMKLLSLVLAILLWNYVVSSNASLTRSKTISGVSGYITGQSTLTTYGLALLDDPSEALENITVTVDVAQSYYSRFSRENLQVMADLSSVRTAGVQEVSLKATSAYGRVTSILPETISLTFEPLDSRLIPVNVELSGEIADDKWYSISRTNPSAVTVSGAASVVRSIAQARVYTDVTGANASYSRAEPFVLLDGEGKEIEQSQLTRSSSSITVLTDVYPTKELPISTDINDVITGRVAEGYSISEISVQPESVVVAADQSLLDGINEMLIEPVSVEGLSQSFSVRASISELSDFKNVSPQQVYVNITISEDGASEWISNTHITFVGKDKNLQLEWVDGGNIQVYASGPRSAIEALKEDGIPVTVNLAGLGVGEHYCELIFPTENYPEVIFEPETPTIHVTLLETPED